jgi:hypothetical protein
MNALIAESRRVARCRAIAAILLDVGEEGEHHGDIDLLERQLRRSRLQAVGRERQQ